MSIFSLLFIKEKNVWNTDICSKYVSYMSECPYTFQQHSNILSKKYFKIVRMFS